MLRKKIWDSLPSPAKSFAGMTLHMVPPEFLLGGRFRRALRFALEADRWPAERTREYQLAHLQDVCRLAYERTEFYRRSFMSVGFDPRELKRLEDISQLPTIDKETLRAHLNEMRAAPVQFSGVDWVSTGGTGGRPLYFYIGADRSAIEYAYLMASWRRIGFRLGRALAVFRGGVVPPDRDGLRHDYDPILRHHYYSNFDMTDENMRRYLEHVRGVGAFYLHAYPSAVATLARFIERAGVEPPPNIQGIIVESENVYQNERQFVERVFGRRYFACYGHSEKLVLAAECEQSTDYHVWPTYGYIELLDEDGNAVDTPGQRGEIVGTGFINRVVPFIRYRTGDYAVYGGARCQACSREHTILRAIDGRWPAGNLVARDGSIITMTALNVHDRTFALVQQFQFVQTVPGSARLRIVPAPRFGSSDVEAIRRGLERKLECRIDFEIEVVESIPLSPRGKAVYVDQRIATEQANGR